MENEWYIEGALEMLEESNPAWAIRIRNEIEESRSLQGYLDILIYLVENETEERCLGK